VKRLHQLGICDLELKWFCKYLSDRLQRVKFDNSYSEWGSVLSGIPQGSALGPLLFLVYVNDMPLQVKCGNLVQIADDTCVICSGKTHEEVSEKLCIDLCFLSLWIKSSQMKVNVRKSNVRFALLSAQSHFRYWSPLSQVSSN